MNFDEFFCLATGKHPYAYQLELGEMAEPPSVLEAHTGAGKTHALIVSWLYGRQIRQTAPRRLVYALPMRSLVEQTAEVAREIRDRLTLSDETLPIHTLMGGVDKMELRGWREWPERDQILIGTIDMLLSRALNRGYSESRYQWPVAFGLLNNDCRWVFDEIQLMQGARVTAAQLDGLRRKLGVALPCETIWASATVDRDALLTIDRPDLGETLQLPTTDRDDRLAKRLNATKLLERVDLTTCKPGDMPRAIAEQITEHHRPATRSIVVLNRVDLAQQVALALERQLKKGKGPRVEVVLLHSRFRPPERREHMDAALAEIDDGPGRIIVATQVIEAGVDVSATLLATETAPFSSIVQRLGRCNRTGDDRDATVLWLDSGQLDAKRAAPYEPGDIATTRTALLDLLGTSLSPAALERLAVPERREAWEVLRRRDLLDLFDTSPDLSGMDVDVARFIRDDDDRSVFVFFRDLFDRKTAATADQPAAEPDELVNVPLHTLGDRDAWLYDPIDDLWKPVRTAPPGATVMLAAADGGYEPKLGWSRSAKGPVIPIEPSEPQQPDALDREEPSNGWMSLADHLTRAEVSARELVTALAEMDLRDGAAEATIAAAAVHDVGKAHPAFQKMIRASAKLDEEPEGLATTLWAKSGKRTGPRNKRRHFRHELASALALRSLDGQIQLPSGAPELVQYLTAAHHGRVRLSIRPAPGEQPPADDPNGRFALGVHEGDELLFPVETPLGELPKVTLTLACMDLGGEERSWVEAACALRDDPQLGPFRLGFLEALVRIADWRASA
ncbi:MAG TPA: CRISPR-associated helicase Cas3' [Solirubrobacteraceae bacterium]|nr:CRISPR-associated helicase Cas3' [Solirubrobacteraceae bacterium]